mgnify:CR=1 FL=1
MIVRNGDRRMEAAEDADDGMWGIVEGHSRIAFLEQNVTFDTDLFFFSSSLLCDSPLQRSLGPIHQVELE